MPTLGDILNSVLQDARNNRDVFLGAFSDPSRAASGEQGTASFEEILAKAASQGGGFGNGSQAPNQVTDHLGDGSAPVLNLSDSAKPLDRSRESFMGTLTPSLLSFQAGPDLALSNEALLKAFHALDSLKGAISGLLQRVSEILKMGPSEAQEAIQSLPGFSAQTERSANLLEALGNLFQDLPEGENPLLLPSGQQDVMVGQWLQQMVAGQQIQLGTLGAKNEPSMVPVPALQGSKTSISGAALRITLQEADVTVSHREGSRVTELFLHLETLQMTATFQGPITGNGLSDPMPVEFRPLPLGDLSGAPLGQNMGLNLGPNGAGAGLQRTFKDLVGLLLLSGVTRAALNSYVPQTGTGQTEPRAGEVFPGLVFPQLPAVVDRTIPSPSDVPLRANLGGAGGPTPIQGIPWNTSDTQNQGPHLSAIGPEAPRSSVISYSRPLIEPIDPNPISGKVGLSTDFPEAQVLVSGQPVEPSKPSLGPVIFTSLVPAPENPLGPGVPAAAPLAVIEAPVPFRPSLIQGLVDGERPLALSNPSSQVVVDPSRPKEFHVPLAGPSGLSFGNLATETPVPSALGGFQNDPSIPGLDEKSFPIAPVPGSTSLEPTQGPKLTPVGNQVLGQGALGIGSTFPASIPGLLVQGEVLASGTTPVQEAGTDQKGRLTTPSHLSAPVMIAGAQGATLHQQVSTPVVPVNSWNHSPVGAMDLSPVTPITLQAVTPIQAQNSSASLNLAFEGRDGDFPGLPVPAHGNTGNLAAGLTQSVGNNMSVPADQDLPSSIDPRQDVATVLGRIADQVGTRASELRALSHLSFQLIPESLGRVTVQLALVDHSVTAKIIVSRPEVREALQNNLVELRTSLNQAGLQIDQLQVQVQGGGANLLAQYFQYQQEGSGYRLPVDPAALVGADEETVENKGFSGPMSTRNLLVDVLA